MELTHMFASAIKALKCTRRGSAPARLIAIVCAVAILAVGFAHNVHQLSQPMSIVTVQVDTGAANDLPDTPKNSAVVIEHCFGCSAMALADLALPFIPHRIAADLPMRKIDEKRPHAPAVEIPPPIVTI